MKRGIIYLLCFSICSAATLIRPSDHLIQPTNVLFESHASYPSTSLLQPHSNLHKELQQYMLIRLAATLIVLARQQKAPDDT